MLAIPASPRLRLDWVEVARGVAAMAVVCSHMRPLANWPTENLGPMGVEFFFLLSGFIILHAHQSDVGRPEALRRYVMRRAGRIFPTYWFVLVVVIMLSMTTLKQAYQPTFTPRFLLDQIFLLPEGTPFIGPAWTLRHELLFYSIFATLILNRWFGLGLLAMWGAAVLWSLPIIGGDVIPTAQASEILLHHYNLDFFIGMAIAILARGRHLKTVAVALATLAIAIFLAHDFQDATNPDSFLKVFALKAAFGAALCLVVALSQKGTPAPRSFMLLGGASYSIYLINRDVGYFIERFCRRLGSETLMHSPAKFLLSVAIAALLGIALHLFLEKPVMRRVNALSAK